MTTPAKSSASLRTIWNQGAGARGGKYQTAATASVVILPNIPLNADGQPRFDNLLLTLPKFLHETAFIDRIHAILPGIFLSSKSPPLPRLGEGLGVKAEAVRAKWEIPNRNAITRLAAGYLKLLFPDLRLTHQELVEYCLRPAASLRQTVRDQLAIMAPEYKKIYIEVA